MDFTGTGQRLSEADIGIAAASLNVTPAHIKTILKIETRGKGFGPRKRPIILFEPHIFDRMLRATPGKADELAARRQKLAHPRWHAIPYVGGNDRNYARLAKAIKVNPRAALQSCSWGLGQVMGFNFKKAGFRSPEDLVAAMKQGEGAQLQAMCGFITGSRLTAKLLRGGSSPQSWVPFVRGYNGKGYAKNNYHVKAAYWFKRYQKDPQNVMANATQAGAGGGGFSLGGGGYEGSDALQGIMDMSREMSWYFDLAKWLFAAVAAVSVGVMAWGLVRMAWKKWQGKREPDVQPAYF